MQQLESFDVTQPDGSKTTIRLCVGDLAAMPPDSADFLFLSAFPNDYTPTESSLIGALYRRGLDVRQLAENKLIDLRDLVSCWVSQPLDSTTYGFRQILCFEPRRPESAGELVADVFRSLWPVVGAKKDRRFRVAMPLLTAGDIGNPPDQILRALVGAAIEWLSRGMPINDIAITLFRPDDELRRVFRDVTRPEPESRDVPDTPADQYDIFVSYSHLDAERLRPFFNELDVMSPRQRVFVDRIELQHGLPWPKQLWAAIEVSRKVVPMFTPNYFNSSYCIDEYNLGYIRARETARPGMLLPVYCARVDPFPSYARLFHYVDACEFSEELLRAAAREIANRQH
jgi:hypothetical protein